MKLINALAAVFSVVLHVAGGSVAYADAYPQRTIKIVCPFPAGGGTDAVARTVAQHLASDNGWNVIVENRGGANGTIGLAEVARATPDGYDLVIGSSDSAVFAPLFNKVPFDVAKDFTPIAIVATTPVLFTSSAKGPFPDLRGLFEAARGKPGILTLGTNGRGSAAHVAYELLKVKTGFDLRHVPYRGSAASVQDLLGAHIDMVGSSIASAVSLVRSGELRALAVTTPQRSSSLPDVPTLREIGFDVEVNVWMGLLGPANMPTDLVQKLHAAVAKVVVKPDVKAALAIQGLEVASLPQAEFASTVRNDASSWREITKLAGIEPQ